MTQRQKVLVVILASLLAMGIKFSLSLAGNNGDLVTYLRLSEMSVQGKDMYLDNQYYNYAPVLYKLLGALRGLAPEPRDFRHGLILLYSLADMGISLVLLTQFGLAVALVFALNPLSMLISGFHNQFDCLAILPALLSAVFYKRYEDRGYDVGQLWLFILFFSLSLMTKHNLRPMHGNRDEIML
ncbi:MAG: hypothetical protein HY794_08205 [Desulfarculus sp.]|nr:hypothetical protein [Desulfarculus sp.]